MRFNYPDGIMNVLSFEVPFNAGAVDALLDLGSDVVVFEFKGSLLTHAAKAERNLVEFEKDFRKKFVEKDDGQRKGIAQLAVAAIAVADRTLKTATKPTAVYPVLVCYEAAVESFWINKYANRIFRDLVGADDRVRPLTVMSVEELESLLPHMARGELTWPTFLSRRFEGDGVRPESVSQALYDLKRESQEVRPPSRNDFLLQAYEDAFEGVMSLYRDVKADEAGSASGKA